MIAWTTDIHMASGGTMAASAWSSKAVQTMDSIMFFRGNTGHRHQHDFLQQHRPQTSTGPSGVSWPRAVNMAPDHIRATDINMVQAMDIHLSSGNKMDQEYQHCLRQ